VTGSADPPFNGDWGPFPGPVALPSPRMSHVQGALTPGKGDVVSRDQPPDRGSPADDARQCRRIVARHARTFSIASRLLPERKRRGAYAIYATCRLADDIVDISGLRRDAGRRALQRFREAALEALEHRSKEPILRELARAVHEFDVPVEGLNELFDGVARDLDDVAIESWDDLERYCQGVAGSVGEMCCPVFGLAADVGGRASTAVRCARTLGVAMQLTNVLRDVGEDASRKRCYLPASELASYGLTREAVLDGTVRSQWPAWREFMAFQVARARDLYRQALPGIPLLQLDAQRCAVACTTGYATILNAIERADYDTLSRRVSVSRLALLGVVWRSWRGAMPSFAGPQGVQ
jgi:phytoene synthase